MTRRTYDLLEVPRGDTYRRLLHHARSVCSEFGLLHQRRTITDSVKHMLATLAPHLIMRTEVSECLADDLRRIIENSHVRIIDP